MTERNKTERKDRAVLVGLDAFSLSREENTDEQSMEELSDLLDRDLSPLENGAEEEGDDIAHQQRFHVLSGEADRQGCHGGDREEHVPPEPPHIHTQAPRLGITHPQSSEPPEVYGEEHGCDRYNDGYYQQVHPLGPVEAAEHPEHYGVGTVPGRD